MAGTPLGHARQEAHRQLHRGEIVEPHQPLEVMQAVVGILDRAADRASGIVDENVDPAVLAQDPLDERRALRRVGNVGAVGLDLEALGGEFLARQIELVLSRATISVFAPASASLRAIALPMPAEPPVMRTRLPATAPRSDLSTNSAGSRWRSQ